jgi:uncharacterized membrane protein YeaQ/YmgE (transglycosylase-associated protein family)
MFSSHGIIVSCIIGLLIGVIAKLLMPGRDPGGCIITMLIGIAGSFVGSWIGRVFFDRYYYAGWIMSIIGAMILLWLYRVLIAKRG